MHREILISVVVAAAIIGILSFWFRPLQSPPQGTGRLNPGCFDAEYCQPSREAFYPNTRKGPYSKTPHDPGHDIYGYDLNNNYCRYGLGQEGIVDGENDLWRFQIYTVQPSMTNLKFQKVMM